MNEELTGAEETRYLRIILYIYDTGSRSLSHRLGCCPVTRPNLNMFLRVQDYKTIVGMLFV